MPLARYFLLVGGALLAVLLLAGGFLPSLPAVERAETQRTTIRIHSEMKLPDRVVFDTSAPTVTLPVAPVIAEDAIPSPLPAADVSAKARQAFAQMLSSNPVTSKLSDAKRPAIKRATPRKSETRRWTASPRKMRLARQHQFDWFGGRMWW